MKAFLCLLALVGASQARQITVTNRCGYDIWIATLTNDQGPPLDNGNIPRVGNGATYTFPIPDGGWGGRFWPKSGCDGSGNNCEVGQSVGPCTNGCDPPAETKVEFFFPTLNNGNDVWYDVSLVDGYSVAAEIIPSAMGGSCTSTRCNVNPSACPTGENDVGDLRVIKNGRTVACLAPCKKWNYPPPFGLGRPESEDPGLHYCCPTPPISPEDCRRGPVINTQYVNLIHRECPTAYSYAYDDEAGLHNCPNNVNFEVKFCG